MKKSLLVTALAVAAFCGATAEASTSPLFAIRADAETIEDLQNHLLDLRDQMNNIQARADAESRRPLSDDETREMEALFAEFEATEANIERRRRLDDVNSRLAAPQQRRTTPDPVDPPADPEPTPQARTRPRASVPAQPRMTDTGKWGFRTQAEYLQAVISASAKGGSVDPRLIANAPTTIGQEGVGQDGGFAVPPDFRTTIIQKVMGEESLLGRTDQMTTSSNSITVPRDETTPWQSTGGIQAYWEGEGKVFSQSKPELTELTVKANKLTALVPLTNELMEDAPSMSGYVNRKAPQKMDFKVNDALLNGTGVGMPLGILKSAGTITVNPQSGQAADTVRHQNIVDMWGRLTASARRNAVWIVNQDAEILFQTMSFRDQTSTPIPVYLPPGGISGAPYGTLMGRPVLTTEASPALGDFGDIILGDMSQYMSVVKAGGIRQDVSMHLWFDYDLAAFKFVLRLGGQPWWNSAIARPNGQPSRGYFVALGPR